MSSPSSSTSPASWAPGSRLVHPVEDPQERRLAAARRADQRRHRRSPASSSETPSSTLFAAEPGRDVHGVEVARRGRARSELLGISDQRGQLGELLRGHHRSPASTLRGLHLRSKAVRALVHATPLWSRTAPPPSLEPGSATRLNTHKPIMIIAAGDLLDSRRAPAPSRRLASPPSLVTAQPRHRPASSPNSLELLAGPDVLGIRLLPARSSPRRRRPRRLVPRG